MTCQVYLPAHTDAWGAPQPERVYGTGATEQSARANAVAHLETVCWHRQRMLMARMQVRDVLSPPAYVDRETAYGSTVALSFQIRVF